MGGGHRRSLEVTRSGSGRRLGMGGGNSGKGLVVRLDGEDEGIIVQKCS